MGRDKARLPLAGVSLARRALDLLAGLFADVAVVTSRERDYADLGYPQIHDRVEGAGPLAGLEAAVAWSGERPVFVLACDLPRVGREVVRRVAGAAVAEERATEPWARVASRDGRLQPLCAMYSPACGAEAGRRLARGRRSMSGLLAAIAVEPVPLDDLRPDPLVNLNTPDDYAAVSR